ncbi:MAG TPA: Nif3-like dinuclear metal center hexameric protein [Gaiellaceae bacterium]|nr:Nif3-like dinuclear metal center hexameric protein [Gaiellaceae bacterium]
MADRDEILAFASDLLELDAYPDYGPMGLQVAGAQEVVRIACGVSASLELFERTAASGAQMLLVHHGLLWDRDPRVIDGVVRRRLKALFDAEITLAAYHLALDAHPEVGNNALLSRGLGIEPAERFAEIGFGGPLAEPATIEEFASRVREALGSEPLVFAHGPERVERAAVVTGGAARYLADAAREGYDLFLTGEAAEPTLHAAQELSIHFVAAGHYATERIGVQALSKRLSEHFDLEWEFIDLPNPV